MNSFNRLIILLLLLFIAVNVGAVTYNSCPSDNTIINSDTNFVGVGLCNVNDPDLNGALVIDANNITLDCGGMTLNGSGYGIRFTSKTGLTIRNCDLNGYAVGVFASSVSDSNFISLTTSYNSTAGLKFSDINNSIFDSINSYGNSTGLWPDYSNNIKIVDSNIVSNSFKGFYCSASCSSFSVHDNNFTNPGASGFYGTAVSDSNFYNNVFVSNTYGLYVCQNNKVYDNFFKDNTGYYYAENCAGGNEAYDNNFIVSVSNYAAYIGDSNFHDNNIIGTAAGSSAIALGNSYANVYNNYISVDNTASGVGINLSGSIADSNIHNNTIDDAYYGIYIQAGSTNDRIYSNSINVSYIGIYLAGDLSYITDLNIFDNNLTGNSASNTVGVYAQASTNNYIHSNRITDFDSGIYIIYYSSFNPRRGITYYDSYNNYIYNNYLNNTVNTYERFNTTLNHNYWNLSSIDCSSPNIIDGNCKGGNYYSDYNGYDIDVPSDGIGDISDYDINSNTSFGLYGKDAYPLTNNSDPLTVSISSPSNNSRVYSSDVNIQWTANYPRSVSKYWFKVDNGSWELMDSNKNKVYSLPASVSLPFTQSFYVKAQAGNLTDNDFNSSEAMTSVVFQAPGSAGILCSDLNGFICSENEACNGSLLDVDDTNACCNIPCVSNSVDLIVESMDLSKEDDSLLFNVLIKNNGLLDAGSFSVDLRKDSVDGLLLGEQEVSELKAGNETNLLFNVSLESLGLLEKTVKERKAFFSNGFTFVVVIDPFNAVQESSKTNNSKDFFFESLPVSMPSQESNKTEIVKGNYIISFKKELFLNELQTFLVTDREGNPVENALIQVQGLISGLTDKSGALKFKALKEGVFDFKVLIEGKEVFSDKMKVKNIIVKLNKMFFNENDSVEVKVVDSINFKPVPNADITVLLPSGNTVSLKTNSDGIASFIARETGKYKLSVLALTAKKTREFNVLTLNVFSSSLNFVLNFVFSTNENVSWILIVLLLLFSVIAGVYALKSYYLLSRKVFGIEIVEEKKIKHMTLTKVLFAFIVFFIPLMIAYYSLIGNGLVVAFIELILLGLLKVIFREKTVEKL